VIEAHLHPKPTFRDLAIAVIVTTCAVACGGFERGELVTPSPTSSPTSSTPANGEDEVQRPESQGSSENSLVELHFANPLQFDAPADRCQISACSRLVQLIDNAEETIDFAAYGIRNQTAVVDALIRAKERGINVRGIVDRTPDGRNYYASTDAVVAALGTVRDDLATERSRATSDGDFDPSCQRPAGFNGPLQCLMYDLGTDWLLAEHASVEDFTDPEGGGGGAIMHNKFFVVDSQYVWTGSMNISDSGTGGQNANLVLVINSPELASIYSAEFEQMYAGAYQENKRADGVEVTQVADVEIASYFSPQDRSMRFGVQGLIARSEQTIHIAMFYLTNKWVVADLIAASQRGVRIRVIVDATSVNNGYSKHEILREAGIDVRVENWGGKMHAKAMVVDDTFLVAGSMNWTRAGDSINDENTLLIRSSRLADEFSGYFENLWRSIPSEWGAPDARPAPESQDSGNSCADGVDNDFDGLADAEDSSCISAESGLTRLPPHHRLSKKTFPEPPGSHRLIMATQCDAAYPDWFVCIPENGSRLSCDYLPYQDFKVLASDPRNYDRDGDGTGCESSNF